MQSLHQLDRFFATCNRLLVTTAVVVSRECSIQVCQPLIVRLLRLAARCPDVQDRVLFRFLVHARPPPDKTPTWHSECAPSALPCTRKPPVPRCCSRRKSPSCFRL